MRTGWRSPGVISAALCAVLCAGQGMGLDAGFYSVPLRGFAPGVYTSDRARFAVFSSDDNFDLPDTPFQRVASRRRTGRGVEIVLVAGEMNTAAKGVLTAYTEDTRLLGIKNPEIVNIARKFTSEKNPVLPVTRFVHGHIIRKTEGIPILSAREVLRGRTGDCTEHAVLTVALLRALGVPSRATVGMILSERFGPGRNVFVFHMWAEAWVNGRWVLADATRPGESLPQRYISFANHSLKAEMPLEYLGAVSAIRDLEVRYAGR